MSEERKRCECRVCLYGREVEAMQATMSVEQAAFVEDMYSRLCHAETDRDWSDHKLRELAKPTEGTHD